MKFIRMAIFFVLWVLVCQGLLYGIYGQERPKEQASNDHERIKDEITKKWDVSSTKYDTRPGHAVQSEEEAAAWRELFGSLIPGKELKIMDAGCGTGEMSFMLAGMGHEVYGIDISPKMLTKDEEKAKSKADSEGGHRVHFQLGDAEKPPFADGSFDAVVCRHVLWTLPSPHTAIDSWAKVIKGNGKVIVIDALWDDGSLTTGTRKKVGQWLRSIMEKEDHANLYSPALQAALPNAKGIPLEKAKAYLEQAGFQDIQDVDLNNLSDIQKKNMPFWYSISRNWDYYAVCGQKRSLK